MPGISLQVLPGGYATWPVRSHLETLLNRIVPRARSALTRTDLLGQLHLALENSTYNLIHKASLTHPSDESWYLFR